jgi:ribosomal protein S18 acetylase RimI-like enzyme
MELRRATDADVAAIAALHAESWKRSYRGVYPDAYLDRDVDAERLAVWSDRFAMSRPDQRTILAEGDGVLAGFAHVLLDEDAEHGALVDNLHVLSPWQRSGLGSRLMDECARVVIAERPGWGVYLWVLEANARARAFYAARGGREIDRTLDPTFEETPLWCYRVIWPDPSTLLSTP